jgi:hypothetical protein
MRSRQPQIDIFDLMLRATRRQAGEDIRGMLSWSHALIACANYLKGSILYP